MPTEPAALKVAQELYGQTVAKGFPVLVMEDSDHSYEHIRDNVLAYAK